MRIVVIGAGISGISAAFHLQDNFNVTLLDQNSTIGGHSNTVTVNDKDNIPQHIDTGFIVYNNKNYPGLLDFFSKIKIEPVSSDMSFSFCNYQADIYYAGTLRGLIPKFTDVFKRKHLKFLREIYISSRKLENSKHELSGTGISISEALYNLGCPREVIDNYFTPIASAIWSCSYSDAAKIPADSYVVFFSNHGLFRIFNRPTWYTIQGGSKTYLKQFSDSFKGNIQTDSKVKNVIHRSGSFEINIFEKPSIICDKIIIATHGDEAFELTKNMNSVSSEALNILNSYKYTSNNVILHTDKKIMPVNKRLWASWNVRTNDAKSSYVRSDITYYMNRLQKLQSKTDFFVTLNSLYEPKKEHILYRTQYTHPVLNTSPAAIKDNFNKLNNCEDIYFCGSYLGYGFHEDGYQSGLKVANIINGSFNIK